MNMSIEIGSKTSGMWIKVLWGRYECTKSQTNQQDLEGLAINYTKDLNQHFKSCFNDTLQTEFINHN